jgi:hypothetical protein
MSESLHAGTQVAHSRATILRYLLIGFLLLQLAAVGSAWAQHQMLVAVDRGAQLTREHATANDSREQLLAVARLLAFLATIVCWLMWQHRAYSNLQRIGSRDTEYTPGWSVGYWFIPIVNLVRPYQITSELYRRSEIQNGRDTIGGLSNPALVGVWWFAYIAWGVSERAYTLILKGATTVPTIISATNVEMGAHLVGLVACVLAIRVIGAIDRFQQAFPVTEQVVAR